MSFTEISFFYDTETTGLDINFSQIIQVGCVLTDNNFNILEELNLSSKSFLDCAFSKLFGTQANRLFGRWCFPF